MVMNEQWKRAVVHLECVTDSDRYYKKEKELRTKYSQNEISQEEYTKIYQGEFGEKREAYGRDVRFHGTAIFVSHNEKRYLLTARHVLFDEHLAKRAPDEYGIFSQYLSDKFIFKHIFRVPSLDEALLNKKLDVPESLMNLQTGVYDYLPYTFSAPDLDLAIISLDQRETTFADELINLGYNPIPSELIEDGPTSEGVELFTVGFPSSTALIAQLKQDPGMAHWSSSYVSLPVYSWGKVSMLHSELPFFWTDMSIYPGNSGGPVIENGKLVGIVSAQASVSLEGLPDVRTRIPFGKIIKTCFVKTLLEEQEAKDRRAAS
jgi:hypothetical protein